MNLFLYNQHSSRSAKWSILCIWSKNSSGLSRGTGKIQKSENQSHKDCYNFNWKMERVAKDNLCLIFDILPFGFSCWYFVIISISSDFGRISYNAFNLKVRYQNTMIIEGLYQDKLTFNYLNASIIRLSQWGYIPHHLSSGLLGHQHGISTRGKRDLGTMIIPFSLSENFFGHPTC